MKKDVEYLEYLWPMRHYLITCGEMGGEANIIARWLLMHAVVRAVCLPSPSIALSEPRSAR